MTTSNSNSITDAIAAAQAAAQAVAGTSVAAPNQSQAPAPVASGSPLDLDDMLSGGVSVDHWVKMTPFGIVIGDKIKPVDTIEVYLNMDEIAYCYQIKYQLNGAAKYHRSYDRVTDAGGGSWMQTIQQAQQIDPKAYEYRSAEIPVINAVDILGKDGKTVAIKAGDTLGVTLPTTGWKPFQSFVQALARKNIDPKSASIKLTLGHKVMQKAGVNDWAVPEFGAFEEVDQVPLFDTVH